ncbi:MAG: 3-hydroxyacyl-ACP dehydratase FabZ family protein [Pseudomonadota bacterium]
MQLEYFQMVDTIVALDGESVTVRSTVPDKSPVFDGHFPGMPLLPGVLLIETMAQTAGFLVLARSKFAQMPFHAAVKQAKMRTFVEPVEVLDVSATLEHDGSGFAMASARIKRAGKPVCEASLTLKTLAFPSDEFAGMIAERARYLGMPEDALPAP